MVISGGEMKVYTDIQGNRLRIRLDGETQEETSMLMRAANSATRSVEAFGSIGKDGTYSWFMIPLDARYDKTFIGNNRKKK